MKSFIDRLSETYQVPVKRILESCESETLDDFDSWMNEAKKHYKMDPTKNPATKDPATKTPTTTAIPTKVTKITKSPANGGEVNIGDDLEEEINTQTSKK